VFDIEGCVVEPREPTVTTDRGIDLTSGSTAAQPSTDESEGAPADSGGTAQEEEFQYRDESRLQAGAQMTTTTMARRLPVLVRRSLRMAWQVDRVATAGLLACQIGTGVLAALGLFAVAGTLTALISSGDLTDRLREAAPQLAMIAGAAGLRALLGVMVTWLTGRLRPVLARAAEVSMVEAALGAEAAANNKPGYNDQYDIADRGA
jgi:ATP-binding cassette subfamily B protein